MVKEAHGRGRARSGAAYQSLPTVATKPKTIGSCMWNTLPNLTGSCARDANQLGVFGLVTPPITSPYQRTVLAVCHNKTVLPIITGRGVKYTHNDHINHILHHHSGPTGIRPVPTEHTHEEIARPHTRSAEHTGSGSGGPHPTTTPIEAYDCEYCCEAVKFGNDFLRMAGIVQMLHARTTPNDN